MGCPPARAEKFAAAIVDAMKRAEINTPLRQAHFLAQVGHECGGLRYMEEIADGKAYEGRRDLGNTSPGDGPRYKGRGLIQLTGRKNYAAFTKWCGVDVLTDPDAVAQLPLAADAAAFYWQRNNLNRIADADDIEKLTRAINGGLNGIDDRRRRFAICKKLLMVAK